MSHLREVSELVQGPRAIDLLRELVRIPSVSGHEAEAARFVAEYMRGAGFDAVTVDPGHNVLGTVNGGADGPGVIFLTHLDTPPAGKMADPWSAQLLDGAPFGKKGQVVYGRSSAASKGAIAAYVEAARAIMAWGRPRWRGRIMVACVTRGLYANHDGIRELYRSTGFKADYAIADDSEDNRIVLGARGISKIQITLHGVETHVGNPRGGVNPVYGLAELIGRIETMPLPSHPALGPASVSAYQLSSVDETPRTPHTVQATVDRRVLPGESPEGVLAPFRQMVAEVCAGRPGLTGEAERVRGMFPFSCPPDSPLVGAVQEAARAAVGRELELMYCVFSSNAGFTGQELGIPGIGFGPGLITDVGDREHVEVDRVIENARITAAVLARLLR